MSFEEEYPSLKECERVVDTYEGNSQDWDDIAYHNKDIQKHCLDKAKVKKAIFLCYQKLYLSQDSLGHNKVMSDYMGELEKELGLK